MFSEATHSLILEILINKASLLLPTTPDIVHIVKSMNHDDSPVHSKGGAVQKAR